MDDLLAELDAIPRDDGFVSSLYGLIGEWQDRAVGLDGVEAILHFVETHPRLDYGAPGPLVHFAERFHCAGYEAILSHCFQRQPTAFTAWMVHRVLHGTRDVVERGIYVALLEQALNNPDVDEQTREEIRAFL